MEGKNLFVGCFRQHIAFRDSCYQCKYTNISRAGDITLGDYWNDDSDFTKKGFRGISVIIANTEIGKSWAGELRKIMRLKETTIEDIVGQQPALRTSVSRPKYQLPSNVHTIKGSVKFMKRYYKGPLYIRILSWLSRLMPMRLSSPLKMLYYSILKNK